MTAIIREPEETTVTIGATTGAATTVEKGRGTTGCFQIPSGSSTTSVQIYAEVGVGLGWVIPKDEDGVSFQTITVEAGGIYCLPSALYNVPRFKLVGDAATTSVPVWLTS